MASETVQTIARLTPLAEVLALIDREVKPVAPRRIPLTLHAALAEDVLAEARPAAALALIDGWALAADLTRDAGGYAPAPLPQVPPRVEAGQPLPTGADSVAPRDTVKVNNGRAEALAPVGAGDGVLPPGADCDGATPLRGAGERLRSVDIAALTAAGITQVGARMPRLRIIAVRSDPILAGTARLIAGGAAQCGAALGEAGGALGEMLTDTNIDAVIAIGGTGSGRNDSSAQILDRAGRVAVHGIGLTPGETAAFGFAASKPVLLLPGRLDAALAVWMTVGRHMLGRLTGGPITAPGETVALSRKVASTVGLAEVIPLRRSGDVAEPLAAKYLSFTALARSHGWLLVPADSEGYSAGTQIEMRPWP
ncbi:MAG TPA: molybdopterin-binding protein [Pseudolabrys sp.]|nr:molybdopterin-binding protein [Pseudolabrys sp.]